MTENIDDYIPPLEKMVQDLIVDRSTTRSFTIILMLFLKHPDLIGATLCNGRWPSSLDSSPQCHFLLKINAFYFGTLPILNIV